MGTLGTTVAYPRSEGKNSNPQTAPVIQWLVPGMRSLAGIGIQPHLEFCEC